MSTNEKNYILSFVSRVKSEIQCYHHCMIKVVLFEYFWSKMMIPKKKKLVYSKIFFGLCIRNTAVTLKKY